MLNDVDVVLVHRERNRTVMSDAGASCDVSNINIILADETGPTLPDNSVISANQAWIPANYETGDTFPAPAPSSPIAEALLSGFDGANHNGTWGLYVNDDGNFQDGSIAGGWIIQITARVRR